jgi:hypothetical protein
VLTYFYQTQDPAGRGAATIVQLLARLNPRLEVDIVDSDQHPALANQMGVQVYNTAVVRAGDRRIQVITTDEEEIALAILRAIRTRETVICFATGHGEYDIDNFAFHTHFEGTQGHRHNMEGVVVVQMQQHGLGRLRRTIEKLGLVARKTLLAGGQQVPADCAALVEANPRTRYTSADSDVVLAYLKRGGGLLMLIEPDYPIDETLAAVLAEAGIRPGDGFVVDPVDHYFTDEQMIAVSQYARHPITRGLALSIYPGARPVDAVSAPHATAMVLFSSSAQSYRIADRLSASEEAASAPRGAIPLAAAAEGRIGSGDPFRLVVFGDADFASISFFPYLANADMVLGSLSWLIREERAPVVNMQERERDLRGVGVLGRWVLAVRRLRAGHRCVGKQHRLKSEHVLDGALVTGCRFVGELLDGGFLLGDPAALTILVDGDLFVHRAEPDARQGS